MNKALHTLLGLICGALCLSCVSCSGCSGDSIAKLVTNIEENGISLGNDGQGVGAGFLEAFSGDSVLSKEFALASSFTHIESNCPSALIVEQGAQNKLRVECLDSSALEQLSAEVRGGTLHINYSGRFVKGSPRLRFVLQSTQPITHIHSERALSLRMHKFAGQQMLSLDLEGASYTELCELDSLRSLDLEGEGASKFLLRGTVDSLRVNMSGAGSLEAKELSGRYAFIKGEGAVSATVGPVAELVYELSGAASLKYSEVSRVTSQKSEGAVSIKTY